MCAINEPGIVFDCAFKDIKRVTVPGPVHALHILGKYSGYI